MNRCSLYAFLSAVLITMVWGGAENTNAADSEAAQVATDSVVGGSLSPTADRQQVVEIEDFQFNPATLTVSVGDTIVFVNRDVVPHTATATERNWDSGALAYQQSWSMVVTVGMAGDYFCEYHPNMRGTLSIRREVGPADTPVDAAYSRSHSTS